MTESTEGVKAVLTVRQLDLARHALGLPNARRETYRNHFVCGPHDDNHAEWMRMVANGTAVRRDGSTLPYGGDDLFHLTLGGALAALQRKERLRKEDCT